MDLSIMDEVVEHKTDEIYKGVMVIINAKVLEALERVQSDIGEWVPRHMRLKEKQFDEKEKQFTKGRIDCMMQISSHIETEVKPKYE
jgi:hypothetical protein